MNATTIEWTDLSWNPITGCTKVSQGCKNCYAETFYERFNGKGTFKLVHLHPDRLKQLKALKKPSRIFVNSMSDLFHEDVPFSFIQRVYLAMMYDTRHTYQILTKRPQRALRVFEWLRDTDNVMYDILTTSKNIWHGVSVEDQATADQRIPLLLQFPVPVRFLSCEPLLGPININTYYEIPHPAEHIHGQLVTAVTHGPNSPTSVQWVIVGGESGRHARPLHPDWVRSIRDVCEDYGVPFFFKQWGQFQPFGRDTKAPYLYYTNAATGESYQSHLLNFVDRNHNEGSFNGGKWKDGYDAMMYCQEAGASECMFLSLGKKKSGHLLDGKVYQQFPVIK